MIRNKSANTRFLLAVLTVIAALVVPGQLNPVARAQEETPTPEPPPGATRVRETDGAVMVYVPAGEYLMGSSEGQGYDDEHPQHTVHLDAFWIDRTEVTNAQYSQCLEAGGCKSSACSYLSEFNAPDQPVVCVTWQKAHDYCQWAGARLPTEAEWEKAARGTDGRAYPWGNDFDGTRLNFCDKNCDGAWKDVNVDDGYKWTAPVGSYPRGASPYGVLDMAGNVWEWASDWYAADHYSRSPERNPQGPGSGNERVVRGGSWERNDDEVRSACRGSLLPDIAEDEVGFRCAISASDLPAPAATATVESPASVLFIGDSGSYLLSEFFPKLAQSGDPPIQIETDEIVRFSTELCLIHQFKGAVDAARSGDWQVVVLEEGLGDRWPYGVRGFRNCVAKFVDDIRQGGGEPVLYMMWGRKGVTSGTTEEIADVYSQTGAELGVKVAPAGLAFLRSMQERPELDLYASDGDHQNPYGYYLMMCVLYATIFGRSPEGLTYRMGDIPADSEWAQLWEVPAGWAISDEDAAFLQRIAWETVQEYQAGRP